MSQQRELFGGAISADFVVPLIDASDLRQVPDTQEVFLSPHDGASIILDVLQPSVPLTSSPQEAIRQHFANLAHDNAAAHSHVDHVAALGGQSDPPASQPTAKTTGSNTPPTPAATFLSGVQHVRKTGTGKALDEVGLCLALWRLGPYKPYDLLLSLNVPRPHRPLPDDSAAEPRPDPHQADHEAGVVSPEREKTYVENFKHTAASLQIHDWGLFA